jgi:hypothetical protein
LLLGVLPSRFHRYLLSRSGGSRAGENVGVIQFSLRSNSKSTKLSRYHRTHMNMTITPKYLVIGLGFEELYFQQKFDNVYNLMIVNRLTVLGSYSCVIRDLKYLLSSLKKPELLKHLVLCGIEIREEILNLFHKCMNLRSIESLSCTILAQHLNLTIFPLLIISSILIDNIESCGSLKLVSYKFLGFSETLEFPNSSLKQI